MSEELKGAMFEDVDVIKNILEERRMNPEYDLSDVIEKLKRCKRGWWYGSDSSSILIYTNVVNVNSVNSFVSSLLVYKVAAIVTKLFKCSK